MQLLNGDCLDLMRKIPASSVDMVFTSPPYNMNLRYRNGRYIKDKWNKKIAGKYINSEDNLTLTEYREFISSALDECLRLSDLVFFNIQMLTGNKPALFSIFGEYSDKIKELIVWDKMTSQPAMFPGVLNSQYELIIVLQNSEPAYRKFKSAQFDRGELSNIWGCRRGKKISKFHGATFPVSLAEKAISNFTEIGSVICDPFMGTGTTGVACVNTGRSFIGIELDAEYFRIAQERLNIRENS